MSSRAKRYNISARHARRRYLGMLALVSVVAVAFGILISLSAGIRPIVYRSFSVVPRQLAGVAENPIYLVERGLPPDSPKSNPLPHTASARAIVVSRHGIMLMSAGIKTREIYRTRPVDNLIQLATALHARNWISESRSGTVTLSAALIIHGTDFTIGRQHVLQVRLADMPSVFVAVDGGVLNIDNVVVRSVSGYQAAGGYYRPFVMAVGRSTLNATDSQFIGLGWNWLASYGVSWMEGSTGRITGSTFEDGFVGAYSNGAIGLTFRYDTFENNAVYGLNLHAYSAGLIIEHVLAQGNKGQGIIFSQHVTNSVVAYSISRDNGENGIMMDLQSNHNRIIDNVVTGNTGDGLVSTASEDNVYDGNLVSYNRIGVRITPANAASTIYDHNQIIANGLTSQGVSLAGSNIAIDNGGQWNWPVIRVTWMAVGALIALFAIARVLAAWQQRRRQVLLMSARYIPVVVSAGSAPAAGGWWPDEVQAGQGGSPAMTSWFRR
jgi:parallel beta-helix repeat protein